jgi:hypothetical protein
MWLALDLGTTNVNTVMTGFAGHQRSDSPP